MKLLLQKSIFLCSCILSVMPNAEAAPAGAPTNRGLYDNLKLPLPRACLPEEGRMKKDIRTNMTNKYCHCPPKAYCDTKLPAPNQLHYKYPSSVRSICCDEKNGTPPPTPTPTPTPTKIVPPQECEVHYYKYSDTNISVANCNPADRTFLGTRVAGYCTQYEAPGTHALRSKVLDLNINLKRCYKTYINTIKMAPSVVTFLKSKELNKQHETDAMKNQNSLNNFVVCRRNAFNKNGFNNGLNTSTNLLMQQSEIDLNKWIKLPLMDNVSDRMRAKGTTEYDILYKKGLKTGSSNIPREVSMYIKDIQPALSDKRINHFTAKIYGHLTTHVLNQRDGVAPNSNENPFLWFFKNTYNMTSSYSSVPYTQIFSSLEQGGFSSLVDAKASGEKGTYVDYFNRQMNAITPKFQSLAVLSQNDTGQPVIPSWNGITCKTYVHIGLCVTVWTNSSSCETCLSPDTKITMTDGTYKFIKDLKAGEAIKAPDNKIAEIESVSSLDWKNLTLYNINDGQLRLTADHPIMTKQGWRAINYTMRKHNNLRYGLKNVKTLKIGDIIVTENGDLPVTRIMPETPVANGKTFNLKLKGDAKAFYANGMLVKSQN